MTLDLGDELAADAAVAITVPGDTDFSAGDAVTWDASNDRVEQTDAAGEDIFGIAKEDAPDTAGDGVSIWVYGPVVASVGGSVVQGDVLVTGSTAGQLDQNADDTGMSVDVDGTADQGVFAPANPMAITDEGGSYPYDGGNALPDNAAGVLLR